MLRRWLLWILIIAFGWLVITRSGEIEKLAQTLSQGHWQWLAVAVLLQAVYYAIFTALYQSAFAAVDVPSRWRDLLPITFASIFVGLVTPGMGAGGAALFVDDAAQRGQSAARTAAGTLLVYILDFAAFTLVLLVGMIYLFLDHSLRFYEVAGAAVLLLLTGGLSGVLLLGLWQPEFLRVLLVQLQQSVNRLGMYFKRPALLTHDWGERNAAEFTQSAHVLASHPARLVKSLGVALFAHAVNLIAFYTLFLAFNQPIQFGPLVAGYAMMILFLIVSPTPNGIGFVEGITPLVLTSFGIPAATATIVVLVFRGLSFWLPVLIGFVLLHRLRTFTPAERAPARGWSVRIVAVVTGLMGLINILSAVTPSLANRTTLLEPVAPLLVRQGGHLTAALAGFALIVLGGGLWRHKQTAWLLTLIVLAVSIISHLIKGLDYEEALLAALLAGWLIYLRPHFHALSDPPSLRRGLLILAAALLFTLVYGTLGFYLLDHQFGVHFNLPEALHQTIVMFTQFYDPGLEPLTGFGHYFATSIYLVGAASLGYALFALIRPVVQRQPATPGERERARAIVETYGHTALARMNLFPDKVYWFSSGGSVVAYAVKGGFAIALGDPIGPGEDIGAAISDFKAFCGGQGWEAAFYQTLPDYLTDYRAAGFECLHIGNEAIVDLHQFTLAGGRNKSLRSAINRLVRLGHRIEVYQPPLPELLLEELREVSDEWLTMVHGREKRFSLGWFDDEYIRNSAVIAVHTPEGVISAFANIVPEYQLREVTSDLMRRRPHVENGTMDFLFVSLFEWASEQGYDSFNLGLSALSGVGAQADAPALERTLHYIYEHVNQFYNFKGLHTFKEKFHPTWSPRYFILPNLTNLPAVGVALTRITSGDAFVWDYLSGLPEKPASWSESKTADN